jgi:fucose 4-O-acetylase-like acetyltransferase
MELKMPRHPVDRAVASGSPFQIEASNVTKRLVWIDSAKGFAIILVILGHVIGGVMARGWASNDGPFKHVYDYIYLFHMPLFFMISGIFAIESARVSPVNALISRTESIAWPYLFWEFLVRTAVLPFARAFMSNPPPDVGWVVRFDQALFGDLSWFLWTLYVMQIILIPIARIPVWILLVASVAGCLLLENRAGIFNPVIHYLPFLLFGAVMRPHLNRLRASNSWNPLLFSFVAFLLMGIALRFGWTAWTPVWLLCGVTGSLASIVFVQYLGRPISEGILAKLGVASLAIYILHPYFQAVTRDVLQMLNASLLSQVGLTTIIAIVGPYTVWRLSQRLGFPWLFRLSLPKYSHNNNLQENLLN